jgi:uncharacterized membrane protein YkvA (DUF1232 family)
VGFNAASEVMTMLKRLAMLWTVVRGDARRLWWALKHPLSPRWLKVGVALLVLYVLSPVDLIPEFIPVLGVMDDLVLIPLVIRFMLNRLPANLRHDIGVR